MNPDESGELFRKREDRGAGADKMDGETEHQAIASTRIVSSAVMHRQDRDIALAGLLLDEQLVDERQLSKAISDWTIHGSEPLLDHLVAAGVVPLSNGEALDAQVTARLLQLVPETEEEVVNGEEELAATVVPLNQLDASGRVTTLLGMHSNLSTPHTQQSRRFTGDYTLLRKLGQGGLGIVWLARDNSLRRYVAIKEVTEAARHNPAAISRFRREAVITGRLEHPSIVPVHQFAEDIETGRTFYAMRFLGKTRCRTRLPNTMNVARPAITTRCSCTISSPHS